MIYLMIRKQDDNGDTMPIIIQLKCSDRLPNKSYRDGIKIYEVKPLMPQHVVPLH